MLLSFASVFKPLVVFWLASSVGRRLSNISRRLGVSRIDYIIDHHDGELQDYIQSDQIEGPQDKNATLLKYVRCASREELLHRLGGVLDGAYSDHGEDTPVWIRAAERRFCEVAARVARDAALTSLASRAARAGKIIAWKSSPLAQTSTDLVEELRLPLTRLGAVQTLLSMNDGDADWASATLRAAADLVGADMFFGDITMKKKNWPFGGSAQPSRSRRYYSDMATQISEGCYKLRHGRAADEDAIRLRRVARRRDLRRFIGLVVTARAAFELKRLADKHGGIATVSSQVQKTTGEAFKRRVVVPVGELTSDLLLNRKSASLGDAAAVATAKQSLSQMLEDWYEDNEKRMPKLERQRRAREGDMTSVSATLASEVRSSMRNLLSGNIARALLIQVQFASTEVYRQMGVIDGLLAANTATIQLLALFPAAFLIMGFLRSLRLLLIALLSESVKSTETVRREMAATLSDAQRLVLLSPPEKPLSGYALGGLALHVHVFRQRAAREKARFHPTRLARLDRALRDLFTPDLTADQLNRLFRHILHENEFLRIGDAHTLPPPITLIRDL